MKFLFFPDKIQISEVYQTAKRLPQNKYGIHTVYSVKQKQSRPGYAYKPERNRHYATLRFFACQPLNNEPGGKKKLSKKTKAQPEFFHDKFYLSISFEKRLLKLRKSSDIPFSSASSISRKYRRSLPKDGYLCHIWFCPARGNGARPAPQKFYRTPASLQGLEKTVHSLKNRNIFDTFLLKSP